MDIKGKEILAYNEGLFEDEFDLDEYIEIIYDNIEEYKKEMFDPHDPIIVKQKKHLGKIDKQEYHKLIELYNNAKAEWKKGEAFTHFYDLLSDLKIIFPFNWTSWTEGKRKLLNPITDFSKCSLIELSMFVTTIFRSDRFDDVSLDQYFENGVMENIFLQFKHLIQ